VRRTDAPHPVAFPLPATKAPDTPAAPELSLVVPVYNESVGIDTVCSELLAVLAGLNRSFEVVAVNDGSSDGTGAILDRIAAREPRFRVIHFRRNFGQTAALMAGFDHSRGEIIVTMDADGQNDPSSIPQLLDKLAEGYDVASGWRHQRQDAWRRVAVSRVANRLISAVSGLSLKDYGCTLKAYRRSALDGVRLYGELHRFVPIFAAWQGARIIEVPVAHRPRVTGQSKYGMGRTGRVVLDLGLVWFLERAASRPMHLFGGIGLASLLGALATGVYTVWLKLALGVAFITTPLPLLVVLLTVLGIVSILSGLLAEMIVRTYYETQDKKPYVIRSTQNLPHP
jgi:glycosyltransferase involved in cell wall biosynthesis